MRGKSAIETHMALFVVSDVFKGKTTVQRHRLVYDCLSEEFSGEAPLHALSMTLKTPEECTKKKDGPPSTV